MVLAKPKVARSAEARAKSGDVSAKVEVFFSWTADVLAGRVTPTFLQLLSALSAFVAAAAVAAAFYLLLRSRVTALAVTDGSALRSVFYSGEPWLVECTSARAASPILYSVESPLRGVRMGTLDCGALLPSGKSTYERFKLTQPSYGPVLLAAANTERPQIAPRNALLSETVRSAAALFPNLLCGRHNRAHMRHRTRSSDTMPCVCVCSPSLRRSRRG